MTIESAMLSLLLILHNCLVRWCLLSATQVMAANLCHSCPIVKELGFVHEIILVYHQTNLLYQEILKDVIVQRYA